MRQTHTDKCCNTHNSKYVHTYIHTYLCAVVGVDVLDKVGERINQTSGYGERLLVGGLTKGHPMKLEVAGRNRLGWSVWRGQHLTNHPLTNLKVPCWLQALQWWL